MHICMQMDQTFTRHHSDSRAQHGMETGSWWGEQQGQKDDHLLTFEQLAHFNIHNITATI